jgi:glycosyltransferase involved in cell wall biosynthesis
VKVSIITASFNSERTIRDTIQSVLSQSYEDIEYIIIDGNSNDNTKNIISEFSNQIKFISEPDKGIYDAINKGIKLSTGDIVGILNSDDFFPNNEVVKNVANNFKNNYNKIDLLYGDISFINTHHKVIRHYSAKNFNNKLFRFGLMPPHPSVYIKRSIYLKYGLYITSFKIASDFELLLRYLKINKLRYLYINSTIVYMRLGGVSNSSLKNRFLLNKEILKACTLNSISTNYIIIYCKYIFRVVEYLTPLLKKSNI